MNVPIWQHKSLYVVLGLTAAAGLAVWLPVPFAFRMAAAALLAFFLPGWWLLRATGFNAGDWLEQIVLSAGVSYGLTVLGALGILYVAGRLSAALVIGFLFGLQLVLMVVCLRRHNQSAIVARPCGRDLIDFLAPVGIAAAFCFANLGYSDYWGDEMNGLLRAIAVIAGQQETLFEHTKGPVEVLLPAVFGLLVGHFEPFTLRFPFALAHTVAMGGYYLLARRLFNRNVGLLAALILGVNGLYLAFGRIVQYQAVVFLMTSLSLLMAYHFNRDGRGKHLWLSSFLAGVGLLSHYDVLLVLPPIGYLVWRRYGWRWGAWWADWPRWVGAGIILVAMAAVFYVPFLLHPHVADTSSYLARIVGASNWPIDNFDELYVFAIMYNSVYYVAFIVLLGTAKVASDVAGLFRLRGRDRKVWMLVAATLVLAMVAAAMGRPLWVPLLASGLLFVLLVGFSSAAIELKAVYVWVAASFIGYVFLVDHPRTHLQIIYPGWSVIVALGVLGLVSRLRAEHSALRSQLVSLRQRGVVAGAIVALCLLFGLFAGYEYLLFLDTKDEYILTYPEHKSPLYWEDRQFPFGSRRLYGAPHRLGWQMVNHLYVQGHLQGDWDSNDHGSNLFWYTLGTPRNPCYPRYYFSTQFEQKEGSTDDSPRFPLTDYVQIGQIWNRDRLQIDVYEFAPLGGNDEMTTWSEPDRYTSFVVPGDFQSLPYQAALPEISTPLPAPPVFCPSQSVLQQIADQYGDSRILDVRDKITLVGYDLEDRWARPEGVVVLTLYWQAVEVVNLPYKTFVHLEDDGGQTTEPRLWSQSDDFPACGVYSTQRWRVGQIITDRHVVRLPADIPPGSYSLRVGLYEPETGLRMDLLDSLGNPQGTDFGLSAVTVRPGG